MNQDSQGQAMQVNRIGDVISIRVEDEDSIFEVAFPIEAAEQLRDVLHSLIVGGSPEISDESIQAWMDDEVFGS